MVPRIMQALMLLLFLLQSFCINVADAAGEGIIITEGDLEALLAIKQSLLSPQQQQQGTLLRSWNASSRLGACQGQWEGIKCAHGGRVTVLQIPFKSLSGSLSPRIADLVSLRKLNLHSNLLTGPIPSSLTSLSSLHALYLHQNHFTGVVPAALFMSPTLQRLDLSHNNFSASPFVYVNSSSSSLTFLSLAYNSFTGPVPAQLATLFPTLTSLNLSHNSFNQSIPALFPAHIYSLDISYNYFNGSLPITLFSSPNLTYFNCSYNRLSGSVSTAIAKKFNSSAFIGNPGLCGYDPSVACAFQGPAPAGPSITSSPSNSTSITKPPNSEKAHHHRFSTATFLFIVIGSVVAAALLLCLIVALVCIFSGKAKSHERSVEKGAVSNIKTTGLSETKAGDKTTKGGASAVGGGKLVHFDGAFKFTADALLCATAEVLGKSTYGTVYKATFEDGNEVAVKRLREGIVKSQRDFEMEVNMLGRVRHPNLLALRGYYWGPRNEKLLIFDFMPGGSLAAFLHARGPETPLTWQTRLNIATGAARGLAHLHNQERVVHGNLTSSNILLDARMNAKLADYGLSRLMTSTANANVIAAANALGYRAPELTKLRKASTKTDVYSFGVVLLELLTGKSPAEAASGDTTATAGMDLPEWVASIVKEEWTNEIFDLEIMKGAAPSEDDLINTLQLAMNCVTPSPSARPDMDDVARQLHDTLHKPDPSRQHPHYATTTSASSESAS